MHYPGFHLRVTALRPYNNKLLPQISLQVGVSGLSTASKGNCSSLQPPRPARGCKQQRFSPPTWCIAFDSPLSLGLPGRQMPSFILCLWAWERKSSLKGLAVPHYKVSTPLYAFFLKLQNNITCFYNTIGFMCHKAASVCVPDFCMALTYSIP